MKHIFILTDKCSEPSGHGMGLIDYDTIDLKQPAFYRPEDANAYMDRNNIDHFFTDITHLELKGNGIAIHLNSLQYKKLLDIVLDHHDCGPEGKSWQSDELVELAEVIQKAGEN